MKGYFVIIRFLDLLFYEFLLKEDDVIREFVKEMGIIFEEFKVIVQSLYEFNLMFGYRGCCLVVIYFEIVEMQIRVIIEVVINVKNEGIDVVFEIMVFFVGEFKEFKYIKDIIVKIVEKVMEEKGVKIEYKVGIMIEVLCVVFIVDEIVKEVEFFLFGINDLIQMIFGFFRDDIGKFLNDYFEKKIFEIDLFVRFDEKGVGKFIKMVVEFGRLIRLDIKFGICGEYGGDLFSIEFCYNVGFDYVLCLLFRVLIVRFVVV